MIRFLADFKVDAAPEESSKSETNVGLIWAESAS